MSETKQINTHIFNFKTSVLRKNNKTFLYFYSKHFCCFLQTTCTTYISSKQEFILTNTKIGFFLKQFYFCEFTKIKFGGKGYKIKKKNKFNMVLMFNRAHITHLFFKNIFLKKIKKYKIYLLYDNYNKHIINTILNVRAVNMFTKKGLRKTRQVILKKKSKK